MSGLFLRVFLWFWLGSSCLLLVFAASLVVAQPDAVTTWRFIGRTTMRYLGSQVASVYETQGPDSAMAAIEEITRDGRVRAWLYAADGRLIAGPSPPAEAGEVIDRALETDDAERVVGGESTLLARRAISVSGTAYVVVWKAPRPLRWLDRLSPARFSARLALVVLTSGGVCLLLTWQITRPIQALRSAARQFADGALSVRLSGRREFQRRDELSELAHEFDRMAARIDTLIASQQQLLVDVSHELRSPLARLALALDLARRRVGDDVPEHDRIDREIQRLSALIEQLLMLARLRGRATQPLEVVNVGELVRDVAHDARFEAEATGRTVAVSRDYDAIVHGHRALLRSALDNVVRNALRYTRPQGAVSIAMEPVNSGRLAVIVRDQGPGVPASALTRLFDPFFRVDDARERASGGTGLGLAIARQAMLAHGGNASAQNHPDGGLAVRLELPLGTLDSLRAVEEPSSGG